MIDFRVKYHSKLRFYRFNDTSLKTDDFFRIGISCIVDYYQGLLVVHCCTTAAPAFPSALLDEPGGRNLDHWRDCHVGTLSLLAMTW